MAQLLTPLLVLVAIVLAIRGLFKPFLGLLVLMTLHFVQPGELIPALAPLRIELVYGIAIFTVLVVKKGGEVWTSMKTDPVLKATVFLLLDIMLTIPFAIWRGGAFAMFLEVVKVFILQIVMTAFIDTQDRLKYILWLLVGFMTWFSGSTLSAYLHGQFYSLNQTFGTLNRAEGVSSLVGDPNELAGILLALLPFLMALVACTKNFLAKLLLVAAGFMTLYVLGLTGARIVFLALFPMALYYILRSKRKFLSLALAVIIGIGLWSSLPEVYRDRYLTVRNYAQGGQLDASNELRLEIWTAGWHMFLDHPIIGVGAGQFATAFGSRYSGPGHHAWMQPHNLYLQVICELGLVGAFVFGNLLWQMMKAIRQGIRARATPGLEVNYQFAVACTMMFIGNMFIGTVSHTLYRPYWYILAGLVAANVNVLKAKSTAEVVPEPEPVKFPGRISPRPSFATGRFQK